MRKTYIALSALAGAAALTVALVWSAAAAPPGSTAARDNGASTAVAASAPDTYSIFASSTSRLNATKPGWRPPAGFVGARMAEARLISQDSTRTVVAVPAAKAPCLISRFADGSESASCALEADQQPASVSYSGAIGLVPDAVDSVTLTMTDGATRVVPVRNNVWTAPDDAAKAAYSLAGRVVNVELMPRSSMPPGDTTDPSQAPNRGPDAAG
jgi:hypothetical protein